MCILTTIHARWKAFWHTIKLLSKYGALIRNHSSAYIEKRYQTEKCSRRHQVQTSEAPVSQFHLNKDMLNSLWAKLVQYIDRCLLSILTQA